MGGFSAVVSPGKWRFLARFSWGQPGARTLILEGEEKNRGGNRGGRKEKEAKSGRWGWWLTALLFRMFLFLSVPRPLGALCCLVFPSHLFTCKEERGAKAL